jgi:circadian clock protein KaiC
VAPAPVRAQAAFGISGLDAMLHGGLPGASNTVVLGPSGSGKTVLGLHFLDAGAARGEPGLYVGFYERPEALLAKAGRLGLALAEHHARGLVQLYWEPPIEGVLDSVVEVRERGVRRVCFDGLHTMRHHADYPDRTRAVFSALASALARAGVTTIYTLETTDLLGPRVEVPLEGVSSLADNLILVRQIEVRAALRRVVSIIKVRDHDYDPQIRELAITERGVTIADHEAPAG